MGFARYVAALTLLIVSSTVASAYEDDTHYLMTYVICRTVGFTHEEARFVAAVDVAMDDRDSTVAAGTIDGKGAFVAHVDAQWMWHAIISDGSKLGTSDILPKAPVIPNCPGQVA
jgi:hypothetical protein